MTLTKEQLDFRDKKNFKITDTFPNLKNNYFIPVLEEEKKLIAEYESALFGKLGCGGAFSMGCIFPIILSIVLFSFPFISNTFWGKIIACALAITIFEYFCIVWYNNTEFQDQHKNKEPLSISVIKKLLLPLTAILSQDQVDGETITLTTNLLPIKNSQNKLTDAQMGAREIHYKRGLSVYESNIMELTASLADGTRIAYNLSQIIHEVYVYKKRGSKHKEKGKIVLKAVFAIPQKIYKALPQGNFTIGEFEANVNDGEKLQKITIKQVLEETNLDCQSICNKCVDMMSAAYSVLEAN